MNIHKSASPTRLRRGELALSVIEGPLPQSAGCADILVCQGRSWRAGSSASRLKGVRARVDRSSRPRVMPGRTDPAIADRFAAA
ncbi:hypothetical protein GTK01_19160 [Aliihoeflea sp. 40Bstr573]|nr:hypothetical protein [Aliihoeflea sp. 40Bstr573]